MEIKLIISIIYSAIGQQKIKWQLKVNILHIIDLHID